MWSKLVRSLLERRHLSADRRPAFTALPRSDSLPDVIWPFDMGTGTTIAMDRRDEPDREGARWLSSGVSSAVADMSGQRRAEHLDGLEVEGLDAVEQALAAAE